METLKHEATVSARTWVQLSSSESGWSSDRTRSLLQEAIFPREQVVYQRLMLSLPTTHPQVWHHHFS